MTNAQKWVTVFLILFVLLLFLSKSLWAAKLLPNKNNIHAIIVAV